MPEQIRPEQTSEDVRKTEDIKSQDTLAADIQLHIVRTLGNEPYGKDKFRYFNGLAYSIRDRLVKMWLDTQQLYYDSMVKRVYYLSLEFLPGRFLMNYITNMGMGKDCQEVIEKTWSVP